MNLDFGIEKYETDLANINLGYGIGIMIGSIIAGAVQKKIGKLKVLYIGNLLFNIF